MSPRGVRLLAAVCLTLACAEAQAQVTGAFSDPLTPNLESDPLNPPRFEPGGVQSSAQADRPTTFKPADAAGATGFDSSNARKKPKPRRKARAAADPPSPSLLPSAKVSPYQSPVPPLGTSALAAAPGTPPVELGPIRRPSQRRRSRESDDPYAPLGVHVGSLLLFPAVELIGGYSTNPTGGRSGKAAALYTAAPELRVQSDWSSHEFRADLRGSYTGYRPDTTPTLSRPNFNGKAESRIDVTKATKLNFGTQALVATDNPGSPNLQAGLARLPVYTRFGGSGGIAHSFNRFELSAMGAAERTAYQDSKLTDGSTASNADRQFNQYGGVLRGSYEMTPGVKPFVEIGIDKRVHDTKFDLSGYRRNSKGLTVKAGSTFELTRQLTGEASLGYTKRDYDDTRLKQITGLIGDASLIWTANALTTVRLTGHSSIGESTIAGVSGVLYRDVGVQVDHAFRRWLIGSVKFGVGQDSYVGLDRLDSRYAAGLGLTYKLDRSMQIKGEFRQDWVRSNVIGNDYTASTFLFGIRLQR